MASFIPSSHPAPRSSSIASDFPRRRSFRSNPRSSRRLFPTPSRHPSTHTHTDARRSFLAKPPAPGPARRVLAVLRDRTTRNHDSPVVADTQQQQQQQRILEVDASDVSDGSTTSAQPNHQPAEQLPASPSPPPLPHQQPPPPSEESYAFNPVGEDDVPEAPQTHPATHQLSALQAELDSLRTENEALQSIITQQTRDLNLAKAKASELDSLSIQLRDTRKKAARKLRELEEDLVVARAAEKQARLELDSFKASVTRTPIAPLNVVANTQQIDRFARTESTPIIPARRKRPSLSYPDTGRPPTSATDSLSTGPNSAQGPGFARVRSTGNVHESLRRKNSRPEVYHPSSMRTVSRKPIDVGRTSPPRTAAKRSLLRRAFVAHIHSNKYRNTRAAWQEFLGAEGTHVTPDQFARAVRGLAIAADARDRDLELLREDVCGAELGDTGVVTWEMFVQFYQRTKHEST